MEASLFFLEAEILHVTKCGHLMCLLFLFLLCIINLPSVSFLSCISKSIVNIESTKVLIKKALHVPYVEFV